MKDDKQFAPNIMRIHNEIEYIATTLLNKQEITKENDKNFPYLLSATKLMVIKEIFGYEKKNFDILAAFYENGTSNSESSISI